ncbi:homocysteine S-methyltransferase family protein, partial [Polaromonas sp.]|uniref:homocysteine S-methyltransferase family protein n=1 Tax=Polaromonas sp. TaxID=1869339 RepID=UPI00286A83C8
LRDDWRSRLAGPIVLSGIIGPRGDGYIAEAPGSVADAARYHGEQAQALKDGGVDMLAAVTMTTSAEAIGIARAAKQLDLPVAISFTVETDGLLPSGETLRAAIEAVDADTPPAYFAVNCAHPLHLERCFAPGGPWTARIRGLRANASTRSHAELDAATELDSGDAPDLAGRYRRLRAPLPALNVLGGCCGTDLRHLRAIRDAWLQ